MLNEKRIKSLIIISLLLIELFVWTANGAGNSWSLGIIGGADDPTQIIVGDEKDKQGEGNGNQPGSGKPDAGNPSVGENPDQNSDREKALKEAEEKGLLILVNKEHPVEQGYRPDDLTDIKYFAPDRSETTRYMRAEAAAAFHQLVDKAAEEGIELKMTTAYRSYNFQKVLYDSYVEREGEAAANTYSAKPGRSEHQTGLAADVSSPSVGYQLSNDYGETKEGKWLAEHAHQYGFIIRFPKGKEDITGYQYEPWHIRYVGLAAAKEIYEKGLTLEEFLRENNFEQ